MKDGDSKSLGPGGAEPTGRHEARVEVGHCRGAAVILQGDCCGEEGSRGLCEGLGYRLLLRLVAGGVVSMEIHRQAVHRLGRVLYREPSVYPHLKKKSPLFSPTSTRYLLQREAIQSRRCFLIQQVLTAHKGSNSAMSSVCKDPLPNLSTSPGVGLFVVLLIVYLYLPNKKK